MVNKFRTHISTHIAHESLDKSKDIPIFSEVDQIINILYEMINRYAILVNSSSFSCSVEDISDWKSIFGFAWDTKQEEWNKKRQSMTIKNVSNKGVFHEN